MREDSPQRRIVLALSLLVVLLVGGAIGFVLGERHGGSAPAPVTDLSAAMYAGALASGERLHGSDATYENALRGYVALLDTLSARDASGAARQIYAADKALALTRLASLADKRLESAESTRLTADALAVCATAGLPYCSSAELRERVREIDLRLDGAVQSK